MKKDICNIYKLLLIVIIATNEANHTVYQTTYQNEVKDKK